MDNISNLSLIMEVESNAPATGLNKRVWGVRCLVRTCNVTKRNRPDARFFRMPPKENPVYKDWIIACGVKEPLFSKNVYVCDRHFPDNEKLKRKKKRDAVPTIDVCIGDEEEIAEIPRSEIKDEEDERKNLVKVVLVRKTPSTFSLCLVKKRNNQQHNQIDVMNKPKKNYVIGKRNDQDYQDVIENSNNQDYQPKRKCVKNDYKDYQTEEINLIEKSNDQDYQTEEVNLIEKSNDQDYQTEEVNLIEKSNDQDYQTEEVNLIEKSNDHDYQTEEDNLIEKSHDQDYQTSNKNKSKSNLNIDNILITNYDEALRCLKHLEEFSLNNENWRALGLVNQLEICFNDQRKHSTI